MDRGGALAVHHGQQRADPFQVHRHVQVGRFLPALGAADHAAGNHGQGGLGAQPVAAGLVEGQFESGQRGGGGAVLQWLRQAHDAPWQMAGVQRAAGGVQAVGAQRGGAPVQRDESRTGGRSGSHQSLSRLWPRSLRAALRHEGGGRAGFADLVV
ncbi:hypothetical protein D3C85_1417630 [compost metagenome]